MNLINLHRT